MLTFVEQVQWSELRTKLLFKNFVLELHAPNQGPLWFCHDRPSVYPFTVQLVFLVCTRTMYIQKQRLPYLSNACLLLLIAIICLYLSLGYCLYQKNTTGKNKEVGLTFISRYVQYIGNQLVLPHKLTCGVRCKINHSAHLRACRIWRCAHAAR